MENSIISDNICTMSSKRLEDLNAVKKQNHSLIIHKKKQFAEVDINRYNSRFPEIIESIWDLRVDFPAPYERFASSLSRLLPNKLLVQGFKVVEIYKNITNSISEQETKNAEILGWCFDILMCTAMIHDDILENSKVRWGKPTYHTLEDVGIYAVNDAILMEHFTYILLKKFFGTKPWYRCCVDIVHDTIFKSAIGQNFEKCFAPNGKLQFHDMTLQNYKRYAMHATGYAFVQLPLMFSHFAAENYDPEFLEKTKNIIYELGEYCGVHNDMTDYVGTVQGKKNDISDIGRGAFTWLITQALINGSSSQKDILKQHYGVNSPDSVSKVIAVFEDLKMFQLYGQFKKNSREYVYAETEKAPISRVHKNSILKLAELVY